MRLILLVAATSLSAQGIEVHESCQQYFPKTSMAKMHDNLRANISKLEHAVTWCEYANPEISSYTSQWRRALTDARFECIEFTGKYNALTPHSLKFLYDPPLIQLASPHSKSILNKRNRSTEADGMATLMHEMFHNTTANNCSPEEHDRRRTNMTKFEIDCDAKDYSMDRVSFLTSLCSGEAPWGPYSSVEEMVYKKARRCGLKKGCENVMTESFGVGQSLSALFLHSEGLPPEKARSLCTRLYYKGACEELQLSNLKLTDYQAVQYALKNPQFGVLRKKLQGLVAQLPRNNFIPLDLIRAQKADYLGFKALRNSTCFKERFEETPQGIKCKSGNQMIVPCESVTRAKQDPRCSAKSRAAVDEWTRNTIPKAMDYEALNQLVELDSDSPDLPFYPKLAEALEHPHLRKILGAVKLDEIRKSLAQIYPAATSRDCQRADQLALANIVKAFDQIPKAPSPQGPNCK